MRDVSSYDNFATHDNFGRKVAGIYEFELFGLKSLIKVFEEKFNVLALRPQMACVLVW